MAPKKKATKLAEGEKADKVDAEASAPDAVKEAEVEEKVADEPDKTSNGEKAPAAATDEKADTPEEKTEGDAPKEGDDDDAAPAAKTTPKEKEKPKELEEDAKPETGKLVSGVAMSEYDSTLDVSCSGDGSIVSSLSQGGFQHLLSGIRANTGAKAGRHLFEVKVLEKKTTETDSTMRVGVSTAGSSLFLGDKTPDSACFDMDGTYYSPTPEDPKKCQNKVFARKIQFQVIGILLNLDSSSPNANTLSLFLDGVRLSEPMPLPAQLVGKALYPTITFKNFTLAVNLGASGMVMKRLPFTCRMFGNGAAADTETASYKPPSAGSKCSVVLPVGLPNEGFFDYVDHFLDKHPEYVELSDRKLLEWCLKSGLNATTWKDNAPSSRDRPLFNFGIPSIDNKAIRNQVRQLSQLVKRHYIIAELKGNLTTKDREEVLARFATDNFAVTAHVALGEPSADQKDWVHGKISAAFAKKQADAIAAKKKAEERKRIAAERAAEREKAREAKKGKKDAEAEEPEKASDEPPEKKQKTDEEAKEEEKEEEIAKPDIGPHVWWVPRGKRASDDMGKKALAGSYANFSMPSDSEGFDKVEFMWAQKASSEEHLNKWITEQKANLIIEDLKPGEWFKEKQKAWKQLYQDMKNKKHTKGKAVKKEETEVKKEKTEDDDEGKEEKDEKEDVVDPLHAGGEDGKPMYSEFLNEDWLFLSWRYQVHLLLHSFAEDAGAKDIHLAGMPVDHVSQYFNTYFNKKFSPTLLGCKDLEQVVELMDDVIKIETAGKQSFLLPLLGKDTEVIDFVKKVEECREDRVRRMEAGDESARLNFPEGGSRDQGEGGKKKPKGKGKGGKSEKKAKGQGGKGSQDQPGQWVRVSTLDKFKARRQENKGFGKKASKRDGAKPQQEAATRPWERNRIKNFVKAPVQRPQHSKGKGGGKFQDRQRRPFQEQRGAQSFQQKRPLPQQEARHFAPAPQRTSGHQGGGHSSSRHYGDAPDPKRARHGQPSSSLPAPSRTPQSSFPGNQRREFSGHGRDLGNSRDAGHRPSHSNSSKGNYKGGDRRPHDNGKDRHGSKGQSKGGGGKGGDRRDDRGYPSSGGHNRGDRDHRDSGRRAVFEPDRRRR